MVKFDIKYVECYENKYCIEFSFLGKNKLFCWKCLVLFFIFVLIFNIVFMFEIYLVKSFFDLNFIINI